MYRIDMIKRGLAILSLNAFLVGLAVLNAAELKTRNLVLVTLDGVRHQELFSGIEPTLLTEEQQPLRKKYDASSGKERRQRLMPFFWGTLAKQGVILGNRALGNEFKLSNPHWFSYPGYAEILTGQYLESADSNDPVRISRETVLEFARRKLDLGPSEVAVFGSWEVIQFIAAHREGSIFCNAGYREIPRDQASERMWMLSQLQRELLTPWDSARHDAVTFHLALEYLVKQQPRLLYIALDETDDWAHDGRYDRVVEMMALNDHYLQLLWDTLQTMSQYRDQTTLIVTTDHGRGDTVNDWKDHGDEVPGAEFAWIAVIGPDTPDRGEIADPQVLYQSQTAATALRFLGLDSKEFNAVAGEPLAPAFDENVQ